MCVCVCLYENYFSEKKRELKTEKKKTWTLTVEKKKTTFLGIEIKKEKREKRKRQSIREEKEERFPRNNTVISTNIFSEIFFGHVFSCELFFFWLFCYAFLKKNFFLQPLRS